MKDNGGYIKIVASDAEILRPIISGNWSYNPENYPDNEVPVSEMAKDFLTTYKYGWKTSYYQNTHDLKSDEVEEPVSKLDDLLQELSQSRGGRV